MIISWCCVFIGIFFVRFWLKQMWITRNILDYDDKIVPFDILNKMSLLCGISYLDPRDIARMKKKEKTNLSQRAHQMIDDIEGSVELDDRIHFIDTSHVDDGIFAECYVWIKEKERAIYLIVRGTDTLEDWQVNFDIRTNQILKDVGFNVHKGFMRQFESIEPFITKTLLAHRHEYDKVIITGHSLGGSVSTIATIYYNEYFSGNVPIYLYTFGCPRVGDKKMGDYMRTQLKTFDHCWRVYDFEDPVPMIPLRPEFEHIHCNTLCLYDEKVLHTSKKDVKWPFRFLTFLACPSLLKPVAKHTINHYAKSLRVHMRAQQMRPLALANSLSNLLVGK